MHCLADLIYLIYLICLICLIYLICPKCEIFSSPSETVSDYALDPGLDLYYTIRKNTTQYITTAGYIYAYV